MIKKIKVVCAILSFSVVFCSFGFSKTVKDVVNSDYYEELLANGQVSILHSGVDEDFVLVPDCEFSNLCHENKILKEKGNFPVSLEYLFLLHKKDLITNPEKSDITSDDLSVVMRSSSKMIDVIYYSNTRKKYMPLYEKTCMVQDEVNRVAIPDRIDEPVEGQTYYVLQDDASFGETLYEETIQKAGDTLYAKLTNLDTMGLAFIKAIKPRNLNLNIITVDCGDDIILYMCMDTNCKKFISVEKKMKESLTSRVLAIKEWIVKMF